MRLPSVSRPVRWLVMLVAIVALGLAAWDRHRYGELVRSDYQFRADYYGRREAQARSFSAVPHDRWLAGAREAEARWRQSPTNPRLERWAWREAGLPPEEFERWSAAFRREDQRRKREDRVHLIVPSCCPRFEEERAEYFGELRRKYAFYARLPWLPALEDGPGPVWSDDSWSWGRCLHCE